MHKKGQSGGIDPEVAAAIAALATSILTGIIAWPAKALVDTVLEYLRVDFLSAFRFLNAWGTLMTVIAFVATMADGIAALIADSRGRGSRVQTTQPQHSALGTVLRNRNFHYWYILYAWSGALLLFGFCFLLYAHVV